MIGYDEQLDGLVRARKYVEKLRRKLNEARSGQPAVLETVRGLGYRVIDS